MKAASRKYGMRLRRLSALLARCDRCGLCQPVCPTFSQSRHEVDSPRGRLALLGAFCHDELHDIAALQGCLRRCLDCGRCQRACPAGLPLLQIFAAGRSLFPAPRPRWQRLVLRGLLARPRRLERLWRLLRPLLPSILHKEGAAGQTSRLHWPGKRPGSRYLPLPPGPPPPRQNGGRTEAKPAEPLDVMSPGLRVAFFPGCLADRMLPELGRACLAIFAHHHAEALLPLWACCGAPALRAGDARAMRRMVVYNLQQLATLTAQWLVTACPACAQHIALWAATPGLDSSQQVLARHWAARTVEMGGFVQQILKAQALPAIAGASMPTVCHQPCRLPRTVDMTALARLVPQQEIVPLREADACCGGGLFSLEEPALASRIGQRKRDFIAASGAQRVVTGCPACVFQLRDVLARNRDRTEVLHWAESYAAALSATGPVAAVRKGIMSLFSSR